MLPSEWSCDAPEIRRTLEGPRHSPRRGARSQADPRSHRAARSRPSRSIEERSQEAVIFLSVCLAAWPKLLTPKTLQFDCAFAFETTVRKACWRGVCLPELLLRCRTRSGADASRDLRARDSILRSFMSSINGDKARFHRERKQRIARRLRYRELFKNPAPSTAPPTPPAAKPAGKERSA